MTQDFTRLRAFVAAADTSGRANYDYGCEIIEQKDDHVIVRFSCTDTDDDVPVVGKLWMHNEGFMAWLQEEDKEPVIFSDRAWVLVAIAYAGP